MAPFPSPPQSPPSSPLLSQVYTATRKLKRLAHQKSKLPNPKSKKKRRIFHPALVLDRSPSLLSTASSAWWRRLASTPPPTPNSFPLFPQIEQAAGSPPRFLGSQIQSLPESHRRRRYHGSPWNPEVVAGVGML